MTKRQRISETEVPKIRTCPRCGNSVLLGDNICTRCGYNMQDAQDWLRQQPPNVVAFTGFGVGVLLMLAALGADGVVQILLLMIGLGCIIGGGMFYALHLLFFDDSQERKK